MDKGAEVCKVAESLNLTKLTVSRLGMTVALVSLSIFRINGCFLPGVHWFSSCTYPFTIALNGVGLLAWMDGALHGGIASADKKGLGGLSTILMIYMAGYLMRFSQNWESEELLAF